MTTLQLAIALILTLTSLFLTIQLYDARQMYRWMNGLYKSENLKFFYWHHRALSQERQHKEVLNREMQYRLALDNICNMNHGDPAYGIWVRQYAATILSRTK